MGQKVNKVNSKKGGKGAHSTPETENAGGQSYVALMKQAEKLREQLMAVMRQVDRIKPLSVRATGHRLSLDDYERALIMAGGWVSVAADILGVSVSAVSKRVKRSARLQEVLAVTKCRYLDLAESKVIQGMNAGESWAICFFLKCHGKERGWIERQDIGHIFEDGVQGVLIAPGMLTEEQWLEQRNRLLGSPAEEKSESPPISKYGSQ